MMLCVLFLRDTVTPHTRCRLKLLKVERIKDFLLMEEELIRNMEHLKPQEQRNEVCNCSVGLASEVSSATCTLNWRKYCIAIERFSGWH